MKRSFLVKLLTPAVILALIVSCLPNIALLTQAEDVICSTATTLWGGKINGINEAKYTETNLGDMVADSFKSAAEDYCFEKDLEWDTISLVPGGHIRTSIPLGDITMANIAAVFPNNEHVIVKKINPKELFELVEIALSGITAQETLTGALTFTKENRYYFQTSGLSITFRPSNAEGSKIETMKFDYADDNLNRTDVTSSIYLASNQSLFSSLAMLKDKEVICDLGEEQAAVATYLRAYCDIFVDEDEFTYEDDELLDGDEESLDEDEDFGEEESKYDAPMTDERVVAVSDYANAGYSLSFSLIDSQGKPLSKTTVGCFIDGAQDETFYISDKDGMVTIAVDYGPHSIRFAQDAVDMYFCNYTGNGLWVGEVDPNATAPAPLPAPVPTAAVAQPTNPAANPSAVPVIDPSADPGTDPDTSAVPGIELEPDPDADPEGVEPIIPGTINGGVPGVTVKADGTAIIGGNDEDEEGGSSIKMPTFALTIPVEIAEEDIEYWEEEEFAARRIKTIKFAKKKGTVKVGKKLVLKLKVTPKTGLPKEAKRITWKIKKKSVLKFVKKPTGYKATVKGKKKGSTKITVSEIGGKNATCTIKVVKPKKKK